MNTKEFYTIFDQMSITKEEFLSKKSKDVVELVCPRCGQTFHRQKTNILRAIKKGRLSFCSPACMLKKDRIYTAGKCENCGKEHDGSYGSGRFCSTECARSFSTKQNRQEITAKMRKTFEEKYPQKIKSPKLCKVCGQETCIHPEICKSRFFKNTTNLEKLGFNLKTVGTLEVYAEYKKIQKYLFDLYHTEEKSYEIIMELHNITSSRTLTLLFNFFRIDRRTFSESVKMSYLNGRKTMSCTYNDTVKYQYKNGYHTSWNNQQFYYRSSFELDYMKELDENKVLYEYEKVRIKYEDTQKNTWRVAIPDFYLPESNTLVEIKSNYTYDKQNMEDKVLEYKKLGFNFKLILEHQEYDYCV